MAYVLDIFELLRKFVFIFDENISMIFYIDIYI